MTNRERVISYLGFEPNKLSVESSLLDAGLIGADEFDINDTTNNNAAKTATIRLIDILFSTPDTTNENGYVIKYDRASLLRLQDKLQSEIDGVIIATGPTIRAINKW